MKKLKGHTTIELTDIHTGEVERYEDDNMFTNAISQIINFALTHNNSMDTNYQIKNGMMNLNETHFNLLYGLLLFDTQIDEKEDMIWAPAGVNMTGCGILNYINGNEYLSKLGSYNSSESDSSQPNMRKMVWDFSTNQANGVISTISLTQGSGGLYGYGSDDIMNNIYFDPQQSIGQLALGSIIPQSKMGKGSNSLKYNQGLLGSTYMDFCIDSENDLKYMFLVSVDGLKILKHKMNAEYFSIFSSVVNIQPYDIDEYPANFEGIYFYHFYNTDEQVLYFWLSNEQNSFYENGKSIVIHKFDMKIKKLTTNWNTFMNNTGSPIDSNIVVTDDSVYFITCADNYGRGTYNIPYRFIFMGEETRKLSNNPTKKMSCSSRQKFYIMNGIVYFNANYQYNDVNNYIPERQIMIDTSNDSVRYSPLIVINTSISNNFDFIPPINNKQLVFGLNADAGNYQRYNIKDLENHVSTNNVYVNTFTMANYIATINVLSTPIVKTPDKTMKIIYIIREEEI